MRSTTRGFIAACLAAVAACGAGCGATNSAGSNAGDQATNGTLTLDEKANGTTVHVHLGDTVIVTLHSTYWSFLPTASLALQPLAPVATAAGSNCPRVMGTGCGTVTASYNIGHVGTGQLHAHRDSCGEALRCIGKQADWSVTVVAS
jgi:hypothetical protein